MKNEWILLKHDCRGFCKKISWWVLTCILILQLNPTSGTDENASSSTSGSSSSIPCPMRCLCFRTTVRCMFLHLEKIPQVPEDTVVLDLRFNRIREIPKNQFRNLTHLTTLLLNNNHITELKSTAFDGLERLKHLYLYKNRIRQVETGVFAGLKNLEQLYLHFNYIESLESTVFADLSNLERLFLQNNRIQRIPDGTFDNMKKLHRLRLDGNALVCDCGMMSFAKMLASHKNTLAAAICELPQDMKGKSVLMMENMESHCRKPIIVEEPRDMDVRFGNTGYFRCRAEGEPNPRIIWLQNSNEITQLPPRYSVMEDGTLMIANIQDEDVGTYECIARSEAGETKSRRAVINLNALEYRTRQRPRFVRVPIDQEVSEGQNLILSCEATGTPKPAIRWYHNENQINQSGRAEITDAFLLIRDVVQSDEGVYRCLASNKVGNISAIAQIQLPAPPVTTPNPVAPTWVLTPSERTVEFGENVVLKCEASGTPTPVVTWTHNGQPLFSSDRISILSEGSRLEIISAAEEDHGEYSCRAENTAGFVETVTNIKVVSGSTPFFTHDLTNLTYRLRPGSQVQLPCSAAGNPPPSILWRKDRLTVVETLRIAILPSGTLIINEFNPSEDTGAYECSAFNDHGFITTDQIVIEQDRVLIRNRENSDNDIITDAFRQAKYEVESAENETVQILFNMAKNEVLTPIELLRLTRFPRGEGRFIARPAEIYERALGIIKLQLEKGLRINVTRDFSYDDLLTTSQLETLGRLSGCISHRRQRAQCNQSRCFHLKYRTIDGTCNNPNEYMWGGSYTPFQRLSPSKYENGFNLPKGWTATKQYNGYSLPPARVVTNKIITTDSITPDMNYTHMLMQWGQFLDHDLDHALPSLSIEAFGERVSCRRTCENVAPCFPMQAPIGDPRIRTRKCMEFTRSAAVCGSGVTSVLFDNIQQREQINQLTSFIDASQVYGSSEEEIRSLRSPTEPIYLRNGIFMYPDKPLMPFATDENFVDCRRNFRESDIGCFLAGDIRANEQVGLLAMHTLWFRQHNFIARQLRYANRLWNDETVFQETRKILGAQMQHITYEEWLPKVVGALGMAELGSYTGYKADVNPTITTEFATAAMRFGHTLINPTLRRLDGNFQTIREGDIPLRQAFFAPWRLVEEGGVDPIIRGLFDTSAKLKKSNEFLNSHLTNELFGHAHLVALDLASMNIQRGRDHGIPFYNEYRKLCNLTVARTFDDLQTEIPDRDLRSKLRQVYGHVDNIDLWVGGVAEQPTTTDSRVGPTFRCILVDQFRRLRDGDRFWYENKDLFRKEQIEEVKRITLARVLCDTADSITHIKQDVFSMRSNLVNCNLVESMRLEFWTTDNCCGNPNVGEESCRNAYYNQESNEIRRKRYARSTEKQDLMLFEIPHLKPLHSFYTNKFESIETAMNYLRTVSNTLNNRLEVLENATHWNA